MSGDSVKNKFILLADDDEKARSGLNDTLRHFGYQVSLYQNGLYLLEAYIMAPKNVGLVITDIKMPELDGETDGLTLGRKLRQNNYTDGIIFMSGNTKYRKNILEIPEPHIFLEKPFGTQELFKAVECLYRG